MEFLDPNYKKKHARLLFTGYALLAVLISALTGLFVLEASGYYINRGGEVVVNSLLFVDSHPGDATVVIGGEIENDRTDSRISVPEGEYLVKVQKDGYRPWQKSLLLEGRKVEFAKYPFLFPEELEVSNVAAIPLASKTYQSPDRRWMLAHDVQTNTYELFDLENDNLDSTKDDFSRLTSEEFSPRSIEIIEWSRDNRSLLIRAESTTQTPELPTIKYFILELRSSEPAVEVPVGDGRTLQNIELSDREPDEVYVHYTNGELSRVKVEDGTKIVVAPAVLEYTTYGDELVLYVAGGRVENEKRSVVISDNLTEYKLSELAASEDAVYSLAIARFDGDWLYAIGSNLDERMSIYEDPLDALELGEEPELISRARVTNLRELKFSQNTRFVAALHDNGFVVYDAEERAPVRFPYPGLPTDYKIAWMDGHRLHGTVNGKLHIWEFDGKNDRDFTEVSNNNEVFFDKNYDNMYYTQDEELVRDVVNIKLITPADQ